MQNEERLNGRVRDHKDRDRALATAPRNDTAAPDGDVDMEEAGQDEDDPEGQEFGSKTVVIHPGSQNLRIGLASDALPRTVPMVIARRWKKCEAEDDGGEPSPKRVKLGDDDAEMPETLFGEEVEFLASF